MELLELPDDVLLVLLVTVARQRQGSATLATLATTSRRLRWLVASAYVRRTCLQARVQDCAPFVPHAQVRCIFADGQRQGFASTENDLFAVPRWAALGRIGVEKGMAGLSRRIYPYVELIHAFRAAARVPSPWVCARCGMAVNEAKSCCSNCGAHPPTAVVRDCKQQGIAVVMVSALGNAVRLVEDGTWQMLCGPGIHCHRWVVF